MQLGQVQPKSESSYNSHHATVVLTRLNVSSQLPGDDAWIDGRLDLMAQWTAPSIAGQTVKPDAWIVFIGPETPEWARDRLRAIVRPASGTISQLLVPFDREAVVGAVFDCIWSREIRPEWLLTVKIDSDDAVAPDFLEVIEKEAAWEHRTLVNQPDGYELDLRTGQAWQLSRQCNEFAGMIERTGCLGDPPVTIFASSDSEKLYNFAKPQNINGKGRWLKVLHADNCIQQANRGGTPVELPKGESWLILGCNHA